jgi:predicted nuclease of predicted toxin-antitoxin system
MRFIVDECTGPSVARWLASAGHDVVSVFDDRPGASDDEILDRAVAEQRILVTNDRDYGEMIFSQGKPHAGVVFLRLDDERPANKTRLLESLLKTHSAELPNRFVVVTETGVRFAAL